MKGIITSIAEGSDSKGSFVSVFVRHEDKSRKVYNSRFDSYFYIRKRDTSKLLKFFPQPTREALQDGVKPMWTLSTGNHKDCYGRALDKIITTAPINNLLIKRRLHKKKVYTFEADVPYVNRFLIDNELKLAVDVNENGDITPDNDFYIEPRYWIVDIETKVFDIDVVDPRGPEPMINIGIYDSYDLAYYILYVGEGYIRNIKNAKYIPCVTEASMIETFITLLEDKDPDILSGFNLQGYDIPKLVTRCRTVGVDPKALSPLKQIKERKFGNTTKWTIGGREIVDLYEIARFLTGKELISHNLDYVNRILGKGKGKLNLPGGFNYNWKHNQWKVLIYNKRDLDCVLEVILEQNLISYLDEIRRLAGINYRDILIKTNLFDTYILRHILHRNQKLWSKTWNRRGTFEGGYVQTPRPGVYKNVVVCDFDSLYPSCIITFNIGRFTINSKHGDISIPYYLDDESKRDPLTGKIPPDTPRLLNHFKFDSKGVSVISELLVDLLAKRKETKLRIKNAANDSMRELYSKQDAAFKTVVNSVFGIMGKETFRLYHADVAAAICAAGRACIHFAIDKAEELGYNVIYGDTDSIFVHLGDDFTGDSVKAGQEISRVINESFAEQCREMYGPLPTNLINLNMETVFDSFALWGKKNYLGKISWKKGRKLNKYDWKGMAAIRTDTAPIIKDMQNFLGRSLVDGKSTKHRSDYLERLELKLLSKDVTLQEVGAPRQLKKPLKDYAIPQSHVRASMYSNANIGTNFGRGDKPAWAYVIPPSGFAPTDVLAFTKNTDIPLGFVPDLKQISKRSIQPVIDQFLGLVGEEYKIPIHKMNWGRRGTLDYFFG